MPSPCLTSEKSIIKTWVPTMKRWKPTLFHLCPTYFASSCTMIWNEVSTSSVVCLVGCILHNQDSDKVVFCLPKNQLLYVVSLLTMICYFHYKTFYVRFSGVGTLHKILNWENWIQNAIFWFHNWIWNQFHTSDKNHIDFFPLRFVILANLRKLSFRSQHVMSESVRASVK